MYYRYHNSFDALLLTSESRAYLPKHQSQLRESLHLRAEGGDNSIEYGAFSKQGEPNIDPKILRS